jgi:hypothetical protein
MALRSAATRPPRSKEEFFYGKKNGHATPISGHWYDTWLYRRSYLVSMPYGNCIQAEFATVRFIDGVVVGISY